MGKALLSNFRESGLDLGMDKVRGVRDAAKASLHGKDGKKESWRGDIKGRAVCTLPPSTIPSCGLNSFLFRQD